MVAAFTPLAAAPLAARSIYGCDLSINCCNVWLFLTMLPIATERKLSIASIALKVLSNALCSLPISINGSDADLATVWTCCPSCALVCTTRLPH